MAAVLPNYEVINSSNDMYTFPHDAYGNDCNVYDLKTMALRQYQAGKPFIFKYDNENYCLMNCSLHEFATLYRDMTLDDFIERARALGWDLDWNVIGVHCWGSDERSVTAKEILKGHPVEKGLTYLDMSTCKTPTEAAKMRTRVQWRERTLPSRVDARVE